jgi:hypothetical protein
MKLQPDMRQVVAAARKRGWVAVPTNNGHLKLTHPEGGLVYCPTTGSDGWRGIKNLKADLRRAERNR